MVVYLSLNSGATVFNSFKSEPSRNFTNTNTYGKNFDCYGEIVHGGVGSKECFVEIPAFNKTVITLTFDYDVERADLFCKTSMATGSTSVLDGISISDDKRKVYIQTQLDTAQSVFYLLVYINGNFGNASAEPLLPDGCLVYTDCRLQKNTDTNRAKALNIMDSEKSGELKNFLYSEESGYDNGLNFDGVDDYVEYPSLLSDRHNVTFLIEVENYQGGALFAEAIEGGYGYGFLQSGDNYSLIRFNKSGIPKWLFSIPKDKLYGKSFTMALTVKNEVAKLYIDGQIYSENLTVDTANVNDQANVRLFIGRGGTGSATYWGRYKLLRFGVWSRELEKSEVEYIQGLGAGFGNSYNVTENLEQCISNLSSEIDGGMQEITLITTSNKYVFDKKPTLTMGDIVHEFTISKDGTSATIEIDVTDDIEINASARENIRVFITGSFENATCNYEDGEFIDHEKNIIITASEGYDFKEHYFYKYRRVTERITNNDTYLFINTSNVVESIYLNDVYNATRIVQQMGQFVNLYKTNESELTELSRVRFYESAGQTGDYGSYINALYILPFELPDDIVGDVSSIILGVLDSNVNSTLLLAYMFDLEGGSIEIPLKYNNIYDYVNTECILHLPFLEKVYLNTEYVIGQTITVDFTIELYSGNLVANIRSSFNNEIIASVQGLIGMNIPFIQKSTNSISGLLGNINKNKINRCFVEVIRNIPYTKNSNVFGGSVVEYGKIGDYEGYLECDSLVLNTNATNQEQEEIKNIIRNGVFI